MVGTPARQSCVSLGLNALGVAIFALSLTAPGIVSVPCSEFERAWATTVGESLPVCRIMPRQTADSTRR
jgi:hypothetical protein